MVLLAYTPGADVTPPLSRTSSTPGAAIRERRLEIGKRQGDLANDAEVSQKLISELERGEQELTSVGIGRVSNIARALGWTLYELQEATGLDFAVEPTILAAPTQIPKAQQPEVDLNDLPPGLQEAIKEFGKRFSDLRDPRWQLYLAGFQWREGVPDDPNAWLDLYRDLDRAGVVPGPGEN